MTERQRIRHRVQVRGREVLQAAGLWPRYRHLLQPDAAAQRLHATLPGALDDYEIDHVRPIAQHDMCDPVQAALALHPNNLRWLRAGANRSKHDGR